MNNLVRDAAYIHYAANKARVQNAMKRLDESTALTEDQINQIILEEFNNTETLNKIKQVFTNMTNKFIEYTKKQLQNRHDPEYLNAIKDKVAEVAKGKNIPLEMLPYWDGVNNIKNVNNIFSKFKPEMYDVVKADNKDACIANIQKFMMDGFNPQGQIKFDQFCLNYFQGGNGNAQKINTNTNQLGDRMNGMVQWCLEFPQVLNAIHNDINGILGLVGKAIQGVNTAPVQPNANPPQNPPSQTEANKQQGIGDSTDYSKTDIRHKAYQYKSILESVFNEADTNPPPQDPPKQTEDKPITGLGKNDRDVNTSGVKIDTQAASQEQKKNQNMGMYMSAIQNVATAILNARLRSTNIIYNDYIKILQTVCPRNEYMNQQPAGGNGQNPAPAPDQNTQNTAATGNG